jgi:hypothetical protein
VLESILQHIDERIPHLPWPSERAAMPTIRPKSAASKQHAIHTPCKPHHQPAHPRQERARAGSFHDQMHVAILNRVVHDPEVR